MQTISIAVAALLGVNAVKFVAVESKFDSFAQTTAIQAAQAKSGVRAKWIELPNCQNFVVNGPTMTFDNSAGQVIPLAEDLSNAIIATCKGPAVAHNPAPPATPEPITTNIPVAQSQVWDPVWKTQTVIPDQEHQVGPLQHGVVDKSLETAGPSGDFHSNWKYTNGGQQPYQASGSSWNIEGAGGANSTNAATSPTNYGPNPTPRQNSPAVTLIQFIDVPEEEMTMQMTGGWVELPYCTGAADEKPLNLLLENAMFATCQHQAPLSRPDKKEAEEKAAIIAAKAAEEADGLAAQNSQAEAARSIGKK